MGVETNVRCIGRAVAVLEQFTMDDPELSLTEISTRIRLSKSTAHRLVRTLEAEKMLELDRQTGKYRLGLKVFRLGSVVANSMELVKQADPILHHLVETTDETAFLQVVDAREALCLRRVDGKYHVRVLYIQEGRHSALHGGATQRVLLAYLPDNQWEEIVANSPRRMTDHTLITREQLDLDRREIHERGYVVSWEDVTLYVCAVGAPVRDASGRVIAAISVGGIVQRFPPERVLAASRIIMGAADELSQRLGYMGPPQTWRGG